MIMKRLALFTLVLFATQLKAQQTPIPSGVFHWADVPVTKSEGREGRKILQGSTAELAYLDIHATTQLKGAAPRPPHAQTDTEEFIFIKEGTAKFTIGKNSQVLGKGSLVLIPPHEMQAIQNVGDTPLTYYVFGLRAKQPADMERSAKAGGTLFINADTLRYNTTKLGGRISYLNRPTATLSNLEIHMTELKGRGPAHTPHTHVDTELTVVLEGETEMIIKDKTYKAVAGDIYLMNSNELHGISNSQDKPCKYLAIRWK
jgi:mannose-6-phosphate isomerase-like protein (cupin superfamily)